MTTTDPTPNPDEEPEPDPTLFPVPDPEPELNEDFEKYFGSDAPPPEGEEGFTLDPEEAIRRLERGEYRAVIAEVGGKETSSNGNPMFKVRFLVTDGPFAGASEFKRFMLSGKGAGWTIELLEAVGLRKMAEGKEPIYPSKLKNRRCVIHVRPQKNDEQYNEVSKVTAHPLGPIDGPPGALPEI